MYAILREICQPFMLGMLILGISLFLTWRVDPMPQRRWFWVWMSYLLLYVWCMPFAAWFATSPLEDRFPPGKKRPEDVQAIVVLGGGVINSPKPDVEPDLTPDSLKRCIKAAELYLDGSPLPIIVTGGHASPGEHGASSSEVMAKQLVGLGIPEKDIIVENRSRNTSENAEFTAAILREKEIRKVALVTTAVHLMRSARLFSKQGVEISPVGCEYYSHELELNVQAFLPHLSAAHQNQAALHEYVGAGLLMAQGKW